MKKRLISFVTLGLVVFLMTACGPAPLKEYHGKTLYTQVGMWVNGNQATAANYAGGQFLPVNTRIKILESDAELIRFRVIDRDMTVLIVNNSSYTGEDIKGLYKQRFGSEQVNLRRFSRSVQQNIRNGEIEQGMSKRAVILARGYPPAHGTSSLDSDTWKYWQSSFNTFNVHFSDDRVSRIET